MADPNVNKEGYIYGKFQTGEKTWSIMSRSSPQFVYLLLGDEKAALIDTLYGLGDLRQRQVVVDGLVDVLQYLVVHGPPAVFDLHPDAAAAVRAGVSGVFGHVLAKGAGRALIFCRGYSSIS